MHPTKIGKVHLPKQKPIRVLFIIDALNWAGGGENALLKIVTNLPKDRFECLIATFDAQRPEWTSNYPVPVIAIPLRRWNVVGSAFKLWRLIRDKQVDIVHTFFPTSDLFGGLIARLSGCEAIISSRRDMGILRGRFHNFLYRISGSLYDEVHAVSEQVREMSIRHDGLSASKVFTIPNGVDLKLYGGQARRRNVHPVILSVGNLRPVKGHDVLIRSAAVVCREFPEAQFLIVGETHTQEFAKELEELANSLGVAGNIRFTGMRHDVPEILGAADVFCLPSRSEGMSNALLEAMAAGLPCVVTAVGGNPEVVSDGKNGILVPSDDSDALARGILRLLHDPNLAEKLGTQARNTIREKFTASAMTERIASSYESLAHSGKRTHTRPADRAGSLA